MKKTFKTFITILSVVLIFASFTAISVAAANKIAAPKTVKVSTTTSSVTLSWSKVKDADYYRIYYKTTTKGKWKTAVKKTTETSRTFEKLPAGKKYYFAVRSFDKTKNGTDYSEMKRINTATKPTSPQKITATAKIKQVTLKWSAVKGATHYRVYQKVNGEWKNLGLTTKTGKTIKNLKSDTTYTFAIRPYVKTKTINVPGARKSVNVTTNRAPNDNYVTKTSGGIKLYPITSETAKQIANNWSTCFFYDYYEGKSFDGKTIVVYASTPKGWYGLGEDSASYDSSGKIRICEYCGLKMGEKDGMCDGDCAVVFH